MGTVASGKARARETPQRCQRIDMLWVLSAQYGTDLSTLELSKAPFAVWHSKRLKQIPRLDPNERRTGVSLGTPHLATLLVMTAHLKTAEEFFDFVAARPQNGQRECAATSLRMTPCRHGGPESMSPRFVWFAAGRHPALMVARDARIASFAVTANSYVN